MKTRVVVTPLLLISVFALPALVAQTRKTPPKKKPTTTAVTPAAPIPAATDKTRARRTGQTTPVEQTEPVSEPKTQPTPVETTKKDETETLTEREKKPATTSTTPAKQVTTPADEFAALRDQIDAASSGPERLRLELKLVDALVEADKRSEAISELHAIADADVFDPQGFYNVGNSFARLGDTEGAVQAYRKAIDQRKGRYSRAYNNLGVVMLRVGRWDESYDALLSALKLENFRYPEASYNLGRLYAARGQNDLAAREWRRVIAQNPEHKAAAEALARIGAEGRVVVDPVRVAAVAKPIESQPKSRDKIADPPKTTAPAAARGPRTLALDQQSYDLLQLARTATEKGNTLDAIGNYQRLLSRQGGYFAPANLEVSFALMNLKRYDEALGNLRLVTTRDGAHYPIAYFHLARVYEIQGDLKTAEELFSKTASMFGSQNAQFLLDVSRVREKKGDFKGALEAMEQYLAQVKQEGQEPAWSAERLTALRQKVSGEPKN
jgi:tetratricopeptide (TPR) repeat protein